MIDTSEQYRHECEVRYVANLSSNQARADYLAGVERKRNKAAADRLRNDAWKLVRENLEAR